MLQASNDLPAPRRDSPETAEPPADSDKPFEEWTPREIVAELDQYVIGQAAAKRSVAIALRNRYRRQRVEESLREEILPNNILMIGPTGVGKTEISRRLARLSGAPFLKVEASKFTEVGYVGRDVESMIRDLTEISVSMVRQEMAEGVADRARKHVEERLLNLLYPRHRRRAGVNPSRSFGADLQGSERAGEEAGKNEAASRPGRREDEGREVESFEALRRRAREELRSGALDRRMVEVDVTERHGAGFELLNQLGMDSAEPGLSEAFETLLPKKKRRRRVTVAEARRLLLQEETHRMVDMDEVIDAALGRVQTSGMIFLDEIDKVCGSASNRQGPDVSREGVQRDLLPIIEGSAVATKYGVVRTDHILFIAAGAFHTARPADLLPELQGRLPIRVELDELSAGDFHRILTEPRNSLLRQYQALLATEKVTLRFSDEALREIADIAHTVNQTTENIGARRLQTILNTLLDDALFDAPENEGATIDIDRDAVIERLSGIARDKDLSSYIL